jgi:hypothetical protein
MDMSPASLNSTAAVPLVDDRSESIIGIDQMV